MTLNNMLGKLDFSAAGQYKPLPAGTYDAQTKSWEAKENKAGDGTNIEATFVVSYTDEDGTEKTRSLINRWSLKPQALWRIKRDLIAMGADPDDFNSDSVDLQTILSERFPQVPQRVKLTTSIRQYKRADGTDGESEQIEKIEAA